MKNNRIPGNRNSRSSKPEPGIRIEHHDGALIGSVTQLLNTSYEQALSLVKAQMEQIANAVETAGGFIGHIKFHLEGAPRSCMLSLTEPGDLQEKSGSDGPVLAQGAVIVFDLSEADFEQMLTDTFPDVPWENEFTL